MDWVVSNCVLCSSKCGLSMLSEKFEHIGTAATAAEHGGGRAPIGFMLIVYMLCIALAVLPLRENWRLMTVNEGERKDADHHESQRSIRTDAAART